MEKSSTYTPDSRRWIVLFEYKALYKMVVSFDVLLSLHHLKIKRVSDRDVDFAQMFQTSVTPTIGLDDSLRHLASPAKHSASIRLDPELLYALEPPTFVGFVLAFDGSAKIEKNGGLEVVRGYCEIRWNGPL